MSSVEQIEEAITQLSPEEFAKLRQWILERDWEEWDAQIEADAKNGKLDRLFAQAVAEHKAGESTPL
jgi:hypothetical protein